MPGFMNYFGGADPKKSARDAIVTLRQQLQMIEKKEEHLQKKIDEEIRKAKQNAVSNPTVATAALRRKKAYQTDLDRLAGTRLQLETQVNTLESANLNAETMSAMKQATKALKTIHVNLDIDKVENEMSDMQAQQELAAEIADAISTVPVDVDEVELKNELEALEEEYLNDKLLGADHVPVHMPPSAVRDAVEDDEEVQLRQLQAELAM